ncbi:hypothetical protein [Terasakiella sp.]|uniref:hypothetical protein n=1 Tax=Terasakiella sp. TaxID=2034861 RepID=UPI003AA7C550
MKKWIFAFAGVLLISACTNTPPVQNLPEMTFKHLAPIPVQAAKLDVVNKSVTSVDGKEISHRLPTSPKQAMTQWAYDRLQPNGSGGRAVFTILEASAVENKLEKQTGLKGVFTTDQSERYDLTVDGRLDVYDAQGKNKGFATAKAHRYMTVSEDTSLLELEKKWYELLEKLMADFNQVMTENIRTQSF